MAPVAQYIKSTIITRVSTATYIDGDIATGTAGAPAQVQLQVDLATFAATRQDTAQPLPYHIALSWDVDTTTWCRSISSSRLSCFPKRLRKP